MIKIKLKRSRKEDEEIVGPGLKESTLARGGGYIYFTIYVSMEKGASIRI